MNPSPEQSVGASGALPPSGAHSSGGEALWRAAISTAARFHQGQFRRDSVTPYVAHVFRVAMTLRHEFGCEDAHALAAAVLHDTIEDTPADYDDVAQVGGTLVADVVAALTKNMILPEAQREIEYDQRLAAADWRARLIKLADVLDNLLDITRNDPQMHGRAVARCERALALAEHETRPEFAKARTLVRAAMAATSRQYEDHQ